MSLKCGGRYLLEWSALLSLRLQTTQARVQTGLRVCGAYKPGPEDSEVKGKALGLRAGSFLHSSSDLALAPFHDEVCFLISPTYMGVKESSYLVWPLRASQIPHVKGFR